MIPQQTILRAQIYGDSLMKGVVTDENTGRYRATMQRNVAAFETQFHMTVQNAARFGLTADKGQSLLEKDLRTGAGFDYALLEFGGNDCNYCWEEVSARPDDPHAPLTELDRFTQIMRGMIKTLHARGVAPLLMTLPPLDAERYFAFISRGKDANNILRFLGDVHMIYRFHELYSSTIEALARQTNTLLIDVRSRFLGLRNFKSLIGPDGIHPNENGYAILVEEFRRFAASRTGRSLCAYTH